MTQLRLGLFLDFFEHEPARVMKKCLAMWPWLKILALRRGFTVLLVFFLLLVFSCRTPPVGEGQAAPPDAAEIPIPLEEYHEEPLEPIPAPLPEAPEAYYPEDYDELLDEPLLDEPLVDEHEIPEEEGEEPEPVEEEVAEEPLISGYVLLPEFSWDDFPWENFPPELNLPEFPALQIEPPVPEPEPELVEPPPPPAPTPPPAPLPAPPPPPPPVAALPAPPPVLPPAPPPEPAFVEPPPPPPFLRPPEPVVPPQVWQPPVEPLPELPPRAIPDTAEDDIIFSRIVRATVGQIIEIPFRGTGWVYLGELANRRGISYDSRRLDIEAGNVLGQSFIFRADAAGTYILRFFRQDFIRDYIINDHVQIIVGEAPGAAVFGPPAFLLDRGRVIAEPRWPPPGGALMLPPAAASIAVPEPAPITEPAVTAPAPPAPPITAIPPSDIPMPPVPPIAPPPQAFAPPAAPPGIPPGDSPADYVRRARAEFNAGRVEPALVILDAMRERFPAGSDEAWLLYGQLLEANSPSRDIRLALEFYRRLVREYPQSNLVLEAQRRIAHLERFFFNIR